MKQDQQLPSIDLNNLQSNLSSKSHKCQYQHQATLFCFSQSCQHQSGFCCGMSTCKCQQEHNNCRKECLNGLNTMLSSKINDTEPIKNKINQTFDQAIDQLSGLRDDFLQFLQNSMVHTKLSQSQKLFMGLAKQQISINQINQKSKTEKQSSPGQSRFQLWNKLNYNPTLSQHYGFDIPKELQKFEEKVLQIIKGISSQTSKLTDKLRHTKRKQINIKENKQINVQTLKLQRQIRQNFLIKCILRQKSSIMNELELCQNLIRMLPKQVNSLKCIFKASLNEFDMSKFYQKCGQAANIVIICKTKSKYPRVIGAYTPLSLNPAMLNRNQSVRDNTLSSFIFSLTYNERFDLLDSSQAIYRYSNKSSTITFGSSEFQICNSSHKIERCYTSCNNKYYSHPSYGGEEPDQYFRINGTARSSFLTEQWEAWTLEMDNKEEARKDDK